MFFDVFLVVKTKRKLKRENLTRRFYYSQRVPGSGAGVCCSEVLAEVVTNQTTGFVGVQSNLQSNFNYRSDNKRLEMNSLVKSDKLKVFQGYNSFNSSYYHKLKDLYQKFGKKHILI